MRETERVFPGRDGGRHGEMTLSAEVLQDWRRVMRSFMSSASR